MCQGGVTCTFCILATRFSKLAVLKTKQTGLVYKLKKITGPNKVLLVLGRRTSAYRDDCYNVQINISPI